jgi:hypothetical protein
MALLSSVDMATFAARGFLRFDAIVPEEINQQFLADIGHRPENEITSPESHYARVMATSTIPVIAAGSQLKGAYPVGGAVERILALPEIAGMIRSLVGSSPVLDHHFLHITFPPEFYKGNAPVAQHTHQDSTIDTRSAFDIQLLYFPHEVTADMGGTRFIPGSHLRVVSEASIGRYQNIVGQQNVVCPAGTILVLHMGIWHGGGANVSDGLRYMFKIRLGPTERQTRLWNVSDLPDNHFDQRPIFWTGEERAPDDIHTILTEPEPWFEFDTARLEYINRIRFWRYLLGDDSFDADYWLTRIENDY